MDANLTLDKFSVRREVSFSGLHIDSSIGYVHADHDKVSAISNVPITKNAEEVR